MEEVQERKDKRVIGDFMIVPVRCFTCGKVLASSYEEYRKRIKQGENAKEVLDFLGIERYCCRRMLLSHVELIDDIIPYG